MIVATRHGGNREVRRLEAPGGPGYPDTPWVAYGRKASVRVAAVACAVRLISETVGSFVMRTHTGDASERRPVPRAPQNVVFQEPGNGWSSFDLWADVAAALELDRHAFLWKTRTSRGVEELFPFPGEYARVTRDGGTGRRRIEASVNNAMQDITDDVIYIRGWAPGPSIEGVSTLELNRSAIGAAAAYEEFRGRYFDNDATPGLVFKMPGNPTRDQRRELMRSWLASHAGPANVNRPGIIWGGAELEKVTSTLKDAQAAEIADPIIRDVARAYRFYPAELIYAVANGSSLDASKWADVFVRFTLLSRLRRIERALAADRDLFPDPARYGRFDVSEFARADAATTAENAHKLMQVGAITRNEARAMLGLPPVDGGDVFQATPVGGAPNAADALPALEE